VKKTHELKTDIFAEMTQGQESREIFRSEDAAFPEVYSHDSATAQKYPHIALSSATTVIALRKIYSLSSTSA
jgi:hypothetical protein